MELNLSYDTTQTTTQVLKLCRPSKAKKHSYGFITPVHSTTTDVDIWGKIGKVFYLIYLKLMKQCE